MYRARFTEVAASAISLLHPDLKKAAKQALQEIKENPYVGKELQHELAGYYSHRFFRYRMVYKPDTQAKIIDIYIVSHRKDAYVKFSELLRNETK